jgi:hypothetical protein
MNEVRTWLWLRQMEHISGHFWHKYSASVNNVVVATQSSFFVSHCIVDLRLLVTPLLSSNFSSKCTLMMRTSLQQHLLSRVWSSEWNIWTIIYIKHIQMKEDGSMGSTNPIGGELRCSVRVSNSCSTCATCRVTIVTNPVISHEWGKDLIVITTNGTHPWSFLTQILRIG